MKMRYKGEGLDLIRSNPPRDDGPCVSWPFAVAVGYGYVWFQGRSVTAHSVALMMRDGLLEPPAGLVACHGPCHDRLCIVHVEWGTEVENAKDKVRDGTHNGGENHPLHKLTQDQVADIRRRFRPGSRNGVPPSNAIALSVEHGVTAAWVRSLVKDPDKWGSSRPY